ncbi:MAG: hypothetical protein CMK83_09250 [Pseudomonadales bacterium]|jgi:hypothetical protein|uniref:FixH family protein n=1 Tax=unclassified Ketobacter TaxID=2639109 RepID=UPI000C4A07B3|nr:MULTISPECIES: FixH family protein [unclassified Ketobacter]MAA60240.1 hypothetical protein [Pseudomonadales bacterium]MEC8810765.1 FixH family protein [Pseudomonadota bacterium]TNC90726.1 MAG: hypothetical protein CSH49_01755 [Alcanivorax sp.]HAU16217.1 hypothetical protein [Gammaproteobacteria bacterium]MAQ24397.1 hypothetical protein [Pseudomonadales bacterium]|tara:strand:- start:400 stop:906 length:507 start_codon:yes stop_codon:yes gene_type:complete
MTQTDSKPWHRQFWPWFLIAIPASSVVMGVVMINLAISGRDSLVREDWYKDGMAINQRLDKQLKARELGIKAQLTLDKHSGDLFLDTENLDISQENELSLQLIHPTLEAKDRTLKLYLAPNNRFYSKLDFTPEGLYYIVLTTPSRLWEIESSINFNNEVSGQALTPNS